MRRDAACGRDIVAKRSIRLTDKSEPPTHRAEAVFTPDGWRVSAWKYTDNSDGSCTMTFAPDAIIEGIPADTAAEVVDTLLRIAAEWAGER